METKIVKAESGKDLLMIKYQDNWYYNENGIWYQWYDLSDINWSTMTHNHPSGTKRVFKIQVGDVSRKKAEKYIKKLMKQYKKDIYLPQYDKKLQREITRYVRREKLKSLITEI